MAQCYKCLIIRNWSPSSIPWSLAYISQREAVLIPLEHHADHGGHHQIIDQRGRDQHHRYQGGVHHRREPDAELSAEPEPVHPRPVSGQPILVDLSATREPAVDEVPQGRDNQGRGQDRQPARQ